MTMYGIGGVGRAPETSATARVAANPYQNTAVRPDVSGQEQGPRQVANEQHLERKIAQRQAQKVQQEQQAQDRIQVSREARDAFQAKSLERRQEERSQERSMMVRTQVEDRQRREPLQAASMRDADGAAQRTGTNLNLMM